MMSRSTALPYSLEAERQVLGAILSDPDAFAVARARLAASDFCLPRHQSIFAVCQELHQCRESIDLLTVSDLLTQRGEIEKAGGHGYVSELADSHITSANLGSAIEIVKRESMKRYLLKAARKAEAVCSHDGDVGAVVEALQRDLHLIIELSGHEGDRRAFHFRAANDLCTVPTATTWLIKPYLEAKTLAMLFGEAGLMKSFLAIDLGLSVATGNNWHGFEVRRKGPVFYVAGEGFLGLNRRVKAWTIQHNIDLQGIPFFVSDRPARFLENGGTAELIQAIETLINAHGDPVLIVIDTLNRNFGPGDENSTADMTRFISCIDAALRTRYGCAVLIIHHSGLTATERARGASALRAALDWEYRLQKKTDGTRILTCTKAKDHAEPLALSFLPETITLDGWNDPEDGEVMTSCVLIRTAGVTPDARSVSGARKVALDALASMGGMWVHIDKWRDAAYLAGVSPTSSQDAKRKAFKRAVSDLRDFGLVEPNGDCWRVKADTGQKPDNDRTCPGI